MLSIEVALILVAMRRRTTAGPAFRRAAFLVPLVLAVAWRAHQALGVPGVIEWDETYYLSAAVTAASGHGLYPYVFGYGPMVILGGFGYAGYLNALAVLIAGPTVIALRAVSLVASIAGLAGIWRLARTWYGTDAAWATAALASWSSLFMITNTARMDSLAFAWVAWALVLFAHARRDRVARLPHVAAGLVFALGLQVHPDVAVTALACGLVYAGAWLMTRSRRSAEPALLFLAGWCAGLALFVVANVLPDPHAFYATTLLARADATRWYAPEAASVGASFADPRILVAKEAARYRQLAGVVPPLEVAVGVLAICAMLWRRLEADRLLLGLIPAVLAAAAILLNNASPLYFVHVAPVLMVAPGALFAAGFARAPRSVMPIPAMLAFAVVVAALAGVNHGRLAVPRTDAGAERIAEAFAARVRSVADRRCKIAGDASLYVRHFADYPLFVSTRPTEVSYAMRFFGDSSETRYWAHTRPDVVAADGPLPPSLAAYVSANGFVERAAGVWVRPDGCGESRRGS